MVGRGKEKYFHRLALGLMTAGYFWLWYFNRSPHVLVKFMTMEAYFLTWLYFLILVLQKKAVFSYNIERLFELNFVLQLFVTPAYWALIHTPMVQSKKFPQYQINWNIYIHVIPMLLLIAEFALLKRQFQNRWRDTVKFYYLFCLPVNLLYSHLQRPVYQFLLYDDLQDYVVIFGFGLVMVGLQAACYYCFKGWNKDKQGQIKKEDKQIQLTAMNPKTQKLKP